MNKKETDELYHQLRLLCVDGSITEKAAIGGITNHLTKPPGDYLGLLIFLAYYGEQFLLPEVSKALKASGIKFNRVVDLGCGTGWLGRGLAREMGDLPTLFVDKRQWTMVDVVADIESKNGVQRVTDELRSGDLIAMGELIHCLRDPIGTLGPIMQEYPAVIVEYNPVEGSSYADSYNRQIAMFGCKPTDLTKFLMGTGAGFQIIHRPPHAIVVTSPHWEVR